MRPSIKLVGLDESIKKIQNIGEASANRITKNVAKSGATVVRRELRKNAPKGERGDGQSDASRTYGPLNKNIDMQQLRSNGKYLPFYRVTTGDAFWGGFIDQGTKHISASYWWVKTVEDIRDQVQKAMADSYERSMLREVAKLK